MNAKAVLLVIVVAMLAFVPGGHGAVAGDGVRATVMFQFGNGETMSYTVTLPADNDTAIRATELACENLSIVLNYSWSSYGAFVNQIGWEKYNQSAGMYWHLLIWRNGSASWSVSEKGASSVHLRNGDVIAWVYTSDTPSWKPHDTMHIAPGYSDAWVTPRGNYNNTGVAHGRVTGYNEVWKFHGMAQYGFSASPVVSGGVIYIADSSALYALNMHGSELWNSSEGASGGWGIASPAVFGDYVIIYTSNGTVSAFYRNNGTLAWSTRIYGEGTSSPALGYYGGMPVLFYATFVWGGNGSLYAICAENGTVLWNRTLMGSNYYGAPAILGDSVVVPIAGIENSSYEWNPVYGVQRIAFNGTYIWNYTSNESIRSAIVIANNHIYFESTGDKGYLTALNFNGTVAWAVETGAATAPPAVHGTTIYVGTNSGRLMAFSDSGTSYRLLWGHTLGGAVKAGVLYDSGKIIAVTDVENSTVYCYDENGTPVWNRTLDRGSYVMSSPAVVDTYLILATGSGYVYALADNASLPAMGEIKVSNAVVGKPITVSVSADEVYLAVLYYRNTTGDEWHAVWMTYSGGEYVGIIPVQSESGTIELYVTLTDSSGAASTTPVTESTVSQEVPELGGFVPIFIFIIALAALRRMR